MPINPPNGFDWDKGVIRDVSTGAQLVTSSTSSLPANAATENTLTQVRADLDLLLAKLTFDHNELTVTDIYNGGETFASQAGTNAVLTFTLRYQEDLIWVLSKGGVSFADPFGGTPANNVGIYCDDGVPQPMTVRVEGATPFRVWAPTGATVYAWAYGTHLRSTSTLLPSAGLYPSPTLYPGGP